MPLDPITIQIAWNKLLTISDECFESLMRSAFSTNIKERHDHSTAILASDGALIAQSGRSLPVHLASMTGLYQMVTDQYDDIAPGDIFIGNDPHVAGGTHLPDINMLAPAFYDGELVGFSCNIAHHADVGGTAAGSMSGALTEIWQEGIRIPATRLYRQGALIPDIERLMLLNMRLPEERKGDLNAQLASCLLGRKRIEGFVEEHGVDDARSIYNEILDRSERRMRAALSEIADGTYDFEDVLDDDGVGTKDILIKVVITKTGDRIAFDFAGSDPQVHGNVNLTFNALQSAVFYTMKALFDPDLPNNSGAFRAVTITAPDNSIVNCSGNAAVALRANSCQRVVDVLLGALSEAVPERVVAAANGANTSAVFSGVNPKTNAAYVYLETLGGGMGARYSRPGKSGVQVHITNTSNLPVEAIEMEYPLQVMEYSLRGGSGGEGAQRGGDGLRRVITPINHTLKFSGAGERFAHRPWGLNGGAPGASGEFRLVAPDGKETVLPSKSRDILVEPGTSVVIDTPGGGGFGPK